MLTIAVAALHYGFLLLESAYFQAVTPVDYQFGGGL